MIHPTAIVDPSVELDSNISIGAYSIIGPGVKIGEGCDIRAHVVIAANTKLGAHNTVFQFASVGEDPQDRKYRGETTQLEIGDANVIREYVSLNRGTIEGGGVTRIGSNNLFMAYAHVAHDCTVGNHVVFANAASLAGHVEVADYVTLGGFTCVHQFCRLGTYSFSGLGTVINRDVTPFTMVAGNQASAYGINKTGLKRHGFSVDCLAALHKAYKLLIKYRGDRSRHSAQLQALGNQYSEVQELIHFVQQSERGVTR